MTPSEPFPGSPDDMMNSIAALRARVAMLEAAMRDCKRYAEDHDDEWVPFRVDDALQDAPKHAAAAIRTERELVEKIAGEFFHRTRIMQGNVPLSDVCDVVRFTMHYLSGFIGKDIP